MSSNLFRSTLLLLLTVGVLPSSGWAGPRQLTERKAPPASETEEMAMDGEEMGEMPDPTAGPPFAELIKDYEQVDGYLTFFRNPKTGHVFLALPEEQLDKPMMLSATLNAGSGGGMFIAPMMWPDLPLYFHKQFRTVQLRVDNTFVTADESAPINRAVQTGTADSVLVSLPIMSQPAPKPAEVDDDKAEDAEAKESEDSDEMDESEESEESDDAPAPLPIPEGTILLDASMLFFSDLLNMGQAGVGLDPSGSAITSIEGFPENTNVELTANAMGGGGFGMFGAGGLTPDSRSTIVKLMYVFSELPENHYTPRLSDERIGYFLTMKQDFTKDNRDTRYVRYINRWDLRKKDPTAELSEPVEPIVFWIENTVPHEYRAAVKEGIESWQPAFEAAGFKNAIIAKQMPDDAEWSPGDVRYNVVRWFVAPGAGFAIGPSRANPYTGQIYDADIGFSADMVAFAAMEYKYLVNPYGMIEAERTKAKAMGIMLPPTVTELQTAASDPQQYRALQERLHQDAQKSMLHRGHLMCDFAHEAAQEAASSFIRAQAIRPGQIDEAEFMRQFLVAIMSHEVGHTLGLRHNYKASTFHDFDHLHTDEAALAGLSGSVMDYTGSNMASRERKQGDYYQTHIGPYDIAAIKYGYTPIPEAGSNPEAELPVLEQIASQWGKKGHAYATDEDQYGWTAAMDPSAVAWDLGRDNMNYYQDQIQGTKELWKGLELTYNGEGTRYQKMRTAFGWGFREYSSAAMGVPRYIGGIYHSRSRVGDTNGQVPYTPVPADEQRAALNFLISNYWSEDSFDFDPSLLRKLAVEREPDFQGSTWGMTRRDIPIHNLVMNVQAMPLFWIYDPLTLSRMNDITRLQPKGTDTLTMAELFGATRGAIWQEAFENRNVDSFRRNLQRMQLGLTTAIYLYGAGYYPEDAVTLARLDLTTLKAGLIKALATPNLDGITRAHYQESVERIDETLEAGVMKFGGFMMF